MNKITLKYVLLFFVTIFASCIDKDYYTMEAPEEPKDESTYTIMMYGCGGGDLDKYMVTNIQEALLAGSSDRVKFTGQIKFSAAFQEYEETAGTQRFIVGDTPENWYTPVKVLDTELALYDPKNLTDFINWSKEQCPADEYILLLWNHGGGWDPNDDGPKNRAVIYDDVLKDKGLSLDELVKGIKDSGSKMMMIYYAACLMGMVVIMAGLTECADYALAASHLTPGIGGDYNSLIYHLNHSTNFEEAIKEYCSDTVSHWSIYNLPFDLTLVDLCKMDNLLGVIKLLSGYLEEMIPVASKFKEDPDSMTNDEMAIYQTLAQAIDSSYMYETDYYAYPIFDLQFFAEILALGEFNSYSAKMIDAASRLKRACKEAIVFKQLTDVIAGKIDLSLAITIVHDSWWKQYGYDAVYPGLRFQQVTNWGNWLSINPIIPSGKLNPNTIIGGSGEDEEGGGDEEGEENEGIDSEVIEQILEIIRNH